jgi:hypothetical protein
MVATPTVPDPTAPIATRVTTTTVMIYIAKSRIRALSNPALLATTGLSIPTATRVYIVPSATIQLFASPIFKSFIEA